MFKFIAVSLVALPFFAFGQDTVCYKATSAVPAVAPETVCLEKISGDFNTRVIKIESKDQSLPAQAKMTVVIPHKFKPQYRFAAEVQYVTFEDRVTHCSDAQDIKLVIGGETTYDKINPSSLEVSLKVEETRDFCHLDSSVETIKYELVK